MVASTAGQFVATVMTLTVLATIVVLARVYVRRFVVRSFGNDDIAIVAAMMLTIVMSAMMVAQAHHGLGKHVVDVPPLEQIKVYRFLYVSIIFYNASIGAAKMSIVIQYMRIFISPAMQLACKIFMGLVVIYTLESAFFGIFSCTPIEYNWNKAIAGKCVDFESLWFTHAGLNIFFDLVTIILPIPVIVTLNLPRKQKIALVGIFALGAFAVVTSILRLKSIYVVANSKDITWDNMPAAMWSAVEVNVGIICASLPSFKAVVKRIFPRLLGSTNYGKSASHQRRWSAHLGSGHKGHHYLTSFNEHERADDAMEMTNNYGQVRTNCEKGTMNDTSAEVRRSADEEEGIKVVTVVSQRQERSLSQGETSYFDESRSRSPSERG